MDGGDHNAEQTLIKDEDIAHTSPSDDPDYPFSRTRTPSKRTKLQEYIDREGVRAQNVKKALEIMHPEDIEFDKAIEEMSSQSDFAGEYGIKGTPPNPDLGRHQRYFSTPKTTRSVTQSSRGNYTQGEAEEDRNTDGALSMAESDVPRISAFAKLEFDDGEFYMNTYSVELGRDLSSARQAFQKVEQPLENGKTKRRKRSASSGASSHVARKVKRKHGRNHPSSVVSENGGVIAVDRSDSESLDGFKTKKAKSTSSSSLQMSRKGSMLFAPQATDYQALAMASLMGTSAYRQTVGSSLPIPSPDACPLIPIHPPISRQVQLDETGLFPPEPAEDTIGSHKAISRKHVKIAYCFEKHYFQLHIYGRNGAYVDDEFCARGDVRALTNGSNIQIGGVSVRFQLPDVALGDTGAESNTNQDFIPNGAGSFAERSSMESSDEIENEDDAPKDVEDDEEKGRSRKAQRPTRNVVRKGPKKKMSKNTASTKVKAGGTGKPAKPEKQVSPDPEMALPVQRRKGPGRPPKNGIMSKREQALLARQAREEAKAAAQKGINGGSAHPKVKAIQASSEIKEEVSSAQPNGKRKYTKRKSKVELMQDQQDTRESTEHTDSVAPEQIAPPKSLREKKTPKPPRTPSPEIDKSTLTEEQLAKPSASYVVLIHDALTEHAEQGKGPMSLHQIYSSIARKYPYFKVVVQTVGWQSSIRHNLLQHEAFEKIEREGKGWMWGLKPGISIEKEKKRRLSPTTQHHQYYPPPHMMQHPYAYYPGMPPPSNGYIPYAPYPTSGPSPPMPPGMRPPPGYPPGTFPPPQRPPLPIINAQADTSSTYQSPYESPYAPSRSPDKSKPPPSEPAPNASSADQDPQPQDPNHPPSSANSTSTPALNPPVAQASTNVTSEKQQKIDHFRSAVVQSMPDKTFAEHLLSSAIARSLGRQTFSTLPGHGEGLPEHPQEVLIMQTVRKIIEEVPKKASTNSVVAETPTSAVKFESGNGPTPDESNKTAVKEETSSEDRGEAKGSTDATKEAAEEVSKETPKETQSSNTEAIEANDISTEGVIKTEGHAKAPPNDLAMTSTTPAQKPEEPDAAAKSET